VRRFSDKPSTVLTVGPITLDLTNRRVTREQNELSLTPTEFSLLEFLMRYSGQVVTANALRAPLGSGLGRSDQCGGSSYQPPAW